MSEKQRNTIDKFIKKKVYFLSYPRLDIITTVISRPINIAKKGQSNHFAWNKIDNK